MKKNVVLFVDDEVNILSSIRRAVIDEEYEAVFACNGPDALELMTKHEVSVMVTDMRMPGMDGLTLLKKVKELYPDMIKLVLSGYTQITQVLATVNEGDIHKFITKPWRMDEDLLIPVRSAIEYYNLKKEKEALKQALEQRNVAYQKVLRSMEDKMTAFRQDIDLIKRLNQMVFTQALENGNPALGREKLMALKKCMSGYLEIVPSSNADVLLKNVMQELNETFLNKAEDLKISAAMPEKEIKGWSQRAFFALRLLLQQLTQLGENHRIECRLVELEYHGRSALKAECDILLRDGMTVQSYMLSNQRFAAVLMIVNTLTELLGTQYFKVSSREKDKHAYYIEIIVI